jgi:hypothetical protein
MSVQLLGNQDRTTSYQSLITPTAMGTAYALRLKIDIKKPSFSARFQCWFSSIKFISLN